MTKHTIDDWVDGLRLCNYMALVGLVGCLISGPAGWWYAFGAFFITTCSFVVLFMVLFVVIQYKRRKA